jgi:N-acetylglutamate synthase-like GNAT family acetyltransferase
MIVQIASTTHELNQIFALRHMVLRAPWNQPYESSYDTLESSSINCYIRDHQNNVVACGRLQENQGKVGQIRYMAVHPNHRGTGLGQAILKRLEQEAKSMELTKIELQARENALKFYEQNRYILKGKTFLLFDSIQHYLMEKHII